MATTPGDGKANPFGDGTGKGAAGTMAGNDFRMNPRGDNDGTVRPRNFIDASRRQPMATPENQAVNQEDAADGAMTAAEEAAAGSESGHDVGVGTVGTATKPFRLGG